MALRSEARSRGFQGAQWLCDTLLEAVPCAGEYPGREAIFCRRRKAAGGCRWIITAIIPCRRLCCCFSPFRSWAGCGKVGLHLFGSGVFVNRGVLHGPWLPIYGTGARAFAHGAAERKLRDQPGLAMFLLGTMVVCGVVEYIHVAWYWN